MRFAFGEDQHAFAESVGRLVRSCCPPSVVREAWAAAPGELDRDLWDRLVEMGLPAALVAESNGGLGLDERSIVLALEEIGWAAVPHPVVESAVVLPTVSARAAEGVLAATDLGGGFVSCAADADLLLLRTSTGDTLHLVARCDVEIDAVESIDRARRLGTVRWQPTTATCVTDDPATIERAALRGAFGTAAMLLGLGRRTIEMAVAHVSGRTQFGVPVGSFQAIKHHLADAYLAVSFARPAVHRAAWALATGASSVRRDVAMAKAMASDAALLAARKSLQCHGAIGYTVEHDLHLFLKRTLALATTWGTADAHRRSLAQELGLAPAVIR